MANVNQTTKLTRKRNAQGMVEFALILPILLLVIFGIVDMGWIAFNTSQLFNGVREGVRYGSVTGFTATKQYLDCSGIRNAIVAQAGFSGIKATSTYIDIIYDDGRPTTDTPLLPAAKVGDCNGSAYAPNSGYVSQDGLVTGSRSVQNGDRIVVTVNVDLQFLTPLIRTFAPQGITVKFKTTRSIFPDGLSASADTM